MRWPGGRRDNRFVAINCGGLAAKEPYCSSTIWPLAYSKRLSFDMGQA
jgi:hypothetical protein